MNYKTRMLVYSLNNHWQCRQGKYTASKGWLSIESNFKGTVSVISSHERMPDLQRYPENICVNVEYRDMCV